MNQLLVNLLITFILTIPTLTGAQNIITNVKYDLGELKCLVCEAVIDELLFERNALNKDVHVPVGRFNLDAKESDRKRVPLHKSEVQLSETVESICKKFDNYVRGKRESDGKLLILPMTLRDGSFNPEISSIGIIQDEDLNKSLRFYCENITEEYEDIMIEHMINDTKDITSEICTKHAKICRLEDESEDGYQHYSPTENDEL